MADRVTATRALRELGSECGYSGKDLNDYVAQNLESYLAELGKVKEQERQEKERERERQEKKEEQERQDRIAKEERDRQDQRDKEEREYQLQLAKIKATEVIQMRRAESGNNSPSSDIDWNPDSNTNGSRPPQTAPDHSLTFKVPAYDEKAEPID